MMLSTSDPATQPITLYWVLGEDLVPVQQRLPQTTRIGTAALNELLWGPPPPNLAGFTTAIPTPEQVLSYPGRRSDWGSRVMLRSLTIVDGVATADFSKELNAYGGGSLRVQLIRQQITQTLRQFPTVRAVRIAIEGQTEGVLEP
jgi:spore germination protein GerM